MSEVIKQAFITGIGTDVGKTFVAAAFVHLWNATYWKPIQTGTCLGYDSATVANLTNHRAKILTEVYSLKAPLSPHAAAEQEDTLIQISNISLPTTNQTLVVEGAGGVLVPLNADDLMIDLIRALGLPAILVSRNYLGSINHTLLSIEALFARSVRLDGIVFVGEENYATEKAIMSRVQCKMARIALYQRVDFEAVCDAADQLARAGFAD